MTLAAIYGTLGVRSSPYASIARVMSALCRVAITETTIKNAKRRGVGPDKLEHSIAFLTVADEEFAAAMLAWRLTAKSSLDALCVPGSMAERQLDEAFRRTKDEWDLDYWRDEEPDYEPEYEPDNEPDFGPDPDDDDTGSGVMAP